MSFFCFRQKTAYEMRISDWSSDVCSSDLQRSGGRFDSGKLEIFRMSGAWTVKLTEIADIVHRRTDITRQIQKGVDQHRPMPCRQHETVAVGPVGTARVVLQIDRKSVV